MWIDPSLDWFGFGSSSFLRIIFFRKGMGTHISVTFKKEVMQPVVGLPCNASFLVKGITAEEFEWKANIKDYTAIIQWQHLLAEQCQAKSLKLCQYRCRIEETWTIARDEAAKCKAAKDVIKILTNKFLDGRVIFVEVAKPRSELRQGSKQTPK